MQDTKCILCKVTTKSVYNKSIFLNPLKPACRIKSIFDETFLYIEKLKVIKIESDHSDLFHMKTIFDSKLEYYKYI